LALRIGLAVVVGLVAFVWTLLAVSHKCSAGSGLIEYSSPFVVATLSAVSLFVFRRYAVVFLLLVVFFALVLLGGVYYKQVIHRGAPEETESLPPPNHPAAGKAGIARLLAIGHHCPACLSRRR
jgi:hypothetical protein